MSGKQSEDDRVDANLFFVLYENANFSKGNHVDEAKMKFPFHLSDCIVTGWSPWTSCSKKCNRGRKYRIRKIVKSERNDGASCPTKLRERRKCVPTKCPGKSNGFNAGFQ